MEDFDSEVWHIKPTFHFISATNPTQHDLHGPDDESQTNINYHHLDVSSNDGMDKQEIHWLFSKLIDDFDSEVWHIKPTFHHISATTPTQHDLHGPDDESQTTINSHHLDESRDDEMDKQEIHWYCSSLIL
jgi:hypothetical protein